MKREVDVQRSKMDSLLQELEEKDTFASELMTQLNEAKQNSKIMEGNRHQVCQNFGVYHYHLNKAYFSC